MFRVCKIKYASRRDFILTNILEYYFDFITWLKFLTIPLVASPLFVAAIKIQVECPIPFIIHIYSGRALISKRNHKFFGIMRYSESVHKFN